MRRRLILALPLLLNLCLGWSGLLHAGTSALDPTLAPLPDPFDPLPVCPPGMLVGPDGLPPNRTASSSGSAPDRTRTPCRRTAVRTRPSLIPVSRSASPGTASGGRPGFNGDHAPGRHGPPCAGLRPALEGQITRSNKMHILVSPTYGITSTCGLLQDHLKRYSERRKAPI